MIGLPHQRQPWQIPKALPIIGEAFLRCYAIKNNKFLYKTPVRHQTHFLTNFRLGFVSDKLPQTLDITDFSL
jgi:hypothetical protein